VLVTYGYNHGEDIRAVPALQHLDRLDQLRQFSGAVRA
jgi:phosphoglycolate phosphatase